MEGRRRNEEAYEKDLEKADRKNVQPSQNIKENASDVNEKNPKAPSLKTS